MKDVESVTVVERIGQARAVGDQVVVVEHRDVSTHGPGVVEHVGANGGVLREVRIDHVSERACRHGEIRAVDVTTKCLGERDPHHGRDSRSFGLPADEEANETRVLWQIGGAEVSNRTAA